MDQSWGSEGTLSPSHLIRLSGLALTLGGVLFVIAGLIQMYVLFNPSSYLAIVGFVGLIALVADALVVLGLIGVCARQLEVAGILGLIAFVIAFFGSAFVIGVHWYNTFVVPSIPPVDFKLFEFFEAERPLLYGGALILAYELLYLGWLLAGVTMLRRTRLFPRPAAVLLIVVSLTAGVVSAVQPAGGLPDFDSVLPYASVLVNMLFYVIIAWLGLTLWTGGNASEDLTRKPGL
jgi:hypothetical protein